MYAHLQDARSGKDFWCSTPSLDLRQRYALAWRRARVMAQIKWFPDHVDPDDVAPEKMLPGGCYYNTPEMCARLEETHKHHAQVGCDLGLCAGSLLFDRQNTDATVTLRERLDGYKWEKMMSALFGDQDVH